MERLLKEFNSDTQAAGQQLLVLDVPDGAALSHWRLPGAS